MSRPQRMAINGESDNDSGSDEFQDAYVTGAGRTGILVAEEHTTRRMLTTINEGEVPLPIQRPEELPVTRGEALQELQNLEEQAAHAVHGVAEGAANAVNTLREQTAAAVFQTTATAEQATSSLENWTAEAFEKAEAHLQTLQSTIAHQERRILSLKAILEQERKSRCKTEQDLADHADKKIKQLTEQLDHALSRIDELSISVSKAESLKPQTVLQPLPTAQSPPVQYTRPPQFLNEDEIHASSSDSRSISRSHRSRSISVHSRTHSQRSSSRTSSHSRASTSKTDSTRHSADRSRGLFDVAIKPKDPPNFAGRTQDDPEIWVGQVSNFFRLVGGAERKKVAYASTLLTGVAQTWWQRQIRSKKEPKSWEAMAAQLIGRFRNVNKADAAMANLMQIRQTKNESTHDFICRFENEFDKVET